MVYWHAFYMHTSLKWKGFIIFRPIVFSPSSLLHHLFPFFSSPSSFLHHFFHIICSSSPLNLFSIICSSYLFLYLYSVISSPLSLLYFLFFHLLHQLSFISFPSSLLYQQFSLISFPSPFSFTSTVSAILYLFCLNYNFISSIIYSPSPLFLHLNSNLLLLFPSSLPHHFYCIITFSFLSVIVFHTQYHIMISP